MRTFSAEVTAALAARALVARDFLSITARDRDTGDPVEDHMWSGAGNVSADVVDPETGSADTREFHGAGTLIQISEIPLVANITVQQVTIRMSQVHERVEQLVRDYDCRQARVEIFCGLFSPATRQMVAPAPCSFVGFVDHIEIRTPSENEDGAVVLTCKSHTQELTRSNPDTRSHESQLRRSATDDFFKDASVVGEWEFFWGKASGKVSATGSQGSSERGGGIGSTSGESADAGGAPGL